MPRGGGVAIRKTNSEAPFLEMLLLGFAIHVRGICPIINRIIVPLFPRTMDQVHHSDAL